MLTHTRSSISVQVITNRQDFSYQLSLVLHTSSDYEQQQKVYPHISAQGRTCDRTDDSRSAKWTPVVLLDVVFEDQN